jgi:hypothetical protein
MNPVFSPTPGSWERQLQRRSGNPLFEPAARRVTQAKVDAARRRDEEDARVFRAAFEGTLKEAVSLPSSVESDVILKLKERLDMLYEQCASLPGDHALEKTHLERLIGVLMGAVQAGAGNDPQALDELAQEGIARREHFRLLEYGLIAQLLRPDSPITEPELVPTLLSEPVEALSAAFSLFDPAQRQLIRRQARTLLEARRLEGYELQEAWNSLARIESLAIT